MKKLYAVIASYAAFLPAMLFLNSCATNPAHADLPEKAQITVLSAGPPPGAYTPQAAGGSGTNSVVAEPVVEETQSQDGNESADSDAVLKKLSTERENSMNIQNQNTEANDELIANEIRRIMLEFGEDAEVPQVFLSEVKGYIRLFQNHPQYRKFVTSSLKRSSSYITLVKTILSQRNIPEDMAYIAFIESGFNPSALSSAGARGLWQFMPGTARNYSLRVGKSVDERRDPIRSTYAAVDYFHDLIAIFGPESFLLAMAAYNSGEGKIISCLKGIDDPFEERNFWHIRPCLSQETREYPPKIVAASIIGNNPEAFGFPRFEPEEDLGNQLTARVELSGVKPVKTVYNERQPSRLSRPATQDKAVKQKQLIYTVKAGNKISEVAEMFGVEASDIKKWNRLKNGKLISDQKIKIYPQDSFEQISYRVKKGDTISGIANSYNVRVSHIVVGNGLKGGWNIKAGQTLAVYKRTEEKPVIHIVKKGTTLGHIAEKHHVSIKDIMIWNNMDSASVYSGQKLKIYREVAREI